MGISRTRVRDAAPLAPKQGQKLTWQTFTALLLLQRALFNQRTLLRERDLERRRKGLYLRLPSLRRKPARRPRSTARRPPATALHIQPLEDSLAWKKWQAQERMQERLNEILRASGP